MKSKNTVFIACSLDGHIADKNDSLGWLEMIPNPDGNDMGYHALNERIDGIIMGRNSFETVCSFDIDWPYSKPVFVLSNTLKTIPEKYKSHVRVVSGHLADILDKLHQEGFLKLYIDGGKTIQSFLKDDLIDEMVITTMPILLGGGPSLFGNLPQDLEFTVVKSTLHLDHIVQTHYQRKR